MPPRVIGKAASAAIATATPSEPAIIGLSDSIDRYPEDPESTGDTIPAGETHESDIPGPSTTFIPRQPSPPLPNLSKHASGLDNYDSDDESDDEIAYTLPIYLSASLSPSLNLFQYPLQHRSLSVPSWASDRGKKITTRVKENVGRIEIEVPVDAGADVWREDRAKELGFVNDVKALNGGDVIGGVNGDKGKDKRGAKRKKDEKWGDKTRLTSENLPNVTGYYSGIVHDGKSVPLGMQCYQFSSIDSRCTPSTSYR